MAQAESQSLFDTQGAPSTGDIAAPADRSIDQAFARLDAALSRLERAATLRPAPDGDYSRLKLEHGALRATVGEALEQIDAVLAQLSAEGAAARGIN